MSYKQVVLRDNPISYWPFDGSSSIRTYATLLQEYEDYQGYLDNEANYGVDKGSLVIEDVSNSGNHGAFTLGEPIFDGILPVVTNASYEENTAGCKIIDTSEIKITNIADSYDMFYHGTEELEFSIEFWISFDTPPKSENDILTIQGTDGVIGKIYADNDKIFFTVFGVNKNTADSVQYIVSKQITSWESQLHVYATYSKRSINIYVNSSNGTSQKLSSNFIFSIEFADRDKIKYFIGPAAVDNHYVINHFAFYDYILPQGVIQYHIIWGTNDAQPESFSRETTSSYFDIVDNESMFAYKQNFAEPYAYRLGIIDNLVTDKTGITFLTNDAGTSQTGTWKFVIPSSAYSNLKGARISWDTGMASNVISNTDKHAMFEISLDNGSTWTAINNGEPIIKFLNSDSNIYPDIHFRITLFVADSSDEYLPRVDNIIVALYKDLSILSDDGGYVLQPRILGAVQNTFTTRKDKLNILSRSNNFGIKTGKLNSLVSVSTTNPSKAYQAVEFWYRCDEFTDQKTQVILDVEDSKEYIFLSSIDFNIYQYGLSKLYINGVEITESLEIQVGETYHIVAIFDSLKNNTLCLGGSKNENQYTNATYGYITMYPDAISSNDILNRYRSYLSSFAAIWTHQEGENTIAHIREYSGQSTDYNSGKPILTYTSPQNNLI